MADRQRQQQQQDDQEIKSLVPQKGTSTSQVLAVVILLPLGGFLLLLAGLTLAATLIGLAVTSPLFVICSPVLVPAALVIGLAVMGFLASGAFGITAISSLSWMANYLRQMRGGWPQQMEYAKLRAQDTQMAQKAREAGQTVQSKAQEATKGGQERGKT